MLFQEKTYNPLDNFYILNHDVMQKTLVLLKPDCIQKGYIGEVISRFEKKGLKVVAMKMFEMGDALIKDHYAHLADKPFFPEIVEYMTMSPIIGMILEGDDSIETLRNMCGATNPLEAGMGTIRGDLALTIRYNIVHASDSEENAKEEVERFFKGEEIFSYKKINDNVL